MGNYGIKGQFNPVSEKISEKYVSITSKDFKRPIWGIKYSNKELNSPFPLGGIGTGYIEIKSDGKFGKTTINNEFVKPFKIDSPFCSIKFEENEFSLLPDGKNCKEIYYWGHFPFIELFYKLNYPINIQLKAFSPFILADSENSNIPSIIFNYKITNNSNIKMKGNFKFYIPENMNFGNKYEVKKYKEGVLIQIGEINNIFLMSKNKESEVFCDSYCLSGIKIPFLLEEKENKELTFILSWYFPWFKDSSGEPHQHHYARKFNSSFEVTEYISLNDKILKEKSINWQEKIYNKNYPFWLKDALINSLYSISKNTLWVDENRPDRWYSEKGFFVHSESFTGCPINETMVCRFHGHFPFLFFFPDLEYTTLYAFKHFQIESGEIPFSFGTPTSLRDPRYHCQHPLNSSEYVQLIYRYYLRTKDKKFLKQFYPSVKKAIEYAKTLDYDNDFLVNEHPHNLEDEFWPANQFYDAWPWKGTSCYVAGIWLATLASGIEIAKLVGDKKTVNKWNKWLKEGKSSFEKIFWNGSYYNLYVSKEETSKICLANQLMGLWCTSLFGIEPPFKKSNIKKAIESIINLNYKKTKYGLVNAMYPDGKKAKCRKDNNENDHASQIFFAENLCSAMTMIYLGKKEGIEVVRRLVEAYFVKWNTPWNQSCLLSSEDGHPVWGTDYYSNMIIWAIILFFEGKNLKNFNFDDFIEK